jgi:hypothetical protein
MYIEKIDTEKILPEGQYRLALVLGEKKFYFTFDADFYGRNSGSIINKKSFPIETKVVVQMADEFVLFMRYPRLGDALAHARKSLGPGCDRVFWHGKEIASV